jgi:predicted DNA-binding transcriptional regulator YafY
MLELLQAHHRLTGVELAERLGVDQRTVRRYASQLIELGIPVEAARGRYGGYRLLPGFKLPPLVFTDDEATAVVLGLLAGRVVGLSTTSTGPATESALAKVQRVLPKALGERVAAIQETLGLTLHRREAVAPETTTVLTLAAAAHQHRRVHLEYGSWRGERTSRELDPYGLVAHGGRWYVTGFDHRRSEVRTFRLDRIAGLRLTAETFTPPDDFDPVGHVVTSLANVPYAHEVEVTLHTTLEQAGRRIPRSAARLTSAGEGAVLLQGRAESLDGMAQLLAGLGWPFVIHKPAALREAVVRQAVSLRAYAETPPPDA